jgi:iron complex outermembrane recepter protein
MPADTRLDNRNAGSRVGGGAVVHEVGLKLENRLVRVSTDVFYAKVHQYQATYNQTIGQNVVNFLSNVGDVNAWGSEFEVTVMPVSSLSVSVNGSYNNTTYDTYTTASCPIESTAKVCDLSGQQVANAPRCAGSTSAQYEFPVSDWMHAFVGTNGAYRGRYNGVVAHPAVERAGDIECGGSGMSSSAPGGPGFPG